MNTQIMGAEFGIPKEEDLYYEYSFRKHCYKFERSDIGFVCETDPVKGVALQKMFDEIKNRINKKSKQ
jgi:hypothetical protein